MNGVKYSYTMKKLVQEQSSWKSYRN